MRENTEQRFALSLTSLTFTSQISLADCVVYVSYDLYSRSKDLPRSVTITEGLAVVVLLETRTLYWACKQHMPATFASHGPALIRLVARLVLDDPSKVAWRLSSCWRPPGIVREFAITSGLQLWMKPGLDFARLGSPRSGFRDMQKNRFSPTSHHDWCGSVSLKLEQPPLIQEGYLRTFLQSCQSPCDVALS